MPLVKVTDIAFARLQSPDLEFAEQSSAEEGLASQWGEPVPEAFITHATP